MSSITIDHKGDFSKTEDFFNSLLGIKYLNILEKYGKTGVDALASVTPKDTGKTSNSWGYKISLTKENATITWVNYNIQNNISIAVILQYGHATRNGGYVEGRDYINPALQPIFDKIAEDLWKEVTDL